MGGGGDAPSVPAWDLAVLVGAALLISTIVISVWTQPVTIAVEDSQEVMTFHTGVSDASVNFEVEYAAECYGDVSGEGGDEFEQCSLISVYLIPHDGETIWDGQLSDDTISMVLVDGETPPEKGESISVGLSDKVPQGEYRVILEADPSATVQFEMTVNRSIPHEYVPALIGGLLIVWGSWRKSQETVD